MNPLLLRITDGTSFIIGMLVVSVSLLAFLWIKSRIIRLILTIVILIGIIFVILSSTPISIWLYIMWCVLSLVSLAANHLNHIHAKITMVKLISTLVTFILSLLLLGFEVPYYLTPTISLKNTNIYVIGDSLSAGTEKKEINWPAYLAKNIGLNITNLAQAGATVETAQQQVNKIPATGLTVIVEIGGNDLLGQCNASEFRKRLDSLLKFLRSQNHQIIMFELPLPPFHNEFGSAQRELAKEYKVTLIPKRFLTNIFVMKNGTLDGIHLSEKGHQVLADSFQKFLVIK
jgi:acyl-CoA thioesterase-1